MPKIYIPCNKIKILPPGRRNAIEPVWRCSRVNDVVGKSIHERTSIGLEKSMQMSFCECFFFLLCTALKDLGVSL